MAFFQVFEPAKDPGSSPTRVKAFCHVFDAVVSCGSFEDLSELATTSLNNET